MNKHAKLQAWVDEVAKMTQPDSIYWCDGSEEENQRLLDLMVETGAATLLNQDKRPGCYLFRSDASDVARVENRTYIASVKQEDAGPTNNWIDPSELKETMKGLYNGCMKGRTLYVIPFSMGPIGSPISKIGVEITDSPYVVVNMRIMTRIGQAVLDTLAIDRQSGVPQYRQLYRQLRTLLLRRALRPGMRLPSTRALSSDLGMARYATRLGVSACLPCPSGHRPRCRMLA